MALSRTDFVSKFPEFADAPTAIVDAKLAYAIASVDDEAFGGQYEMAVYYLCAHLISQSPNGVNARLDPKSTETIYLVEFDRIKKGHSFRGLLV